jgi:SAM-dependent methyltransferase
MAPSVEYGRSCWPRYAKRYSRLPRETTGRVVSRAKLQDRAREIAARTFLGGPVESFEAIGRLQLITLLRCGLYPDSRVLDLGCGCLRGGYWLIHFLAPDRYFGLEPNEDMLDVGRRELLDAGLVAEKRPRFLTNDTFDPSEFGVRFDFFLARSVWTHASRGQIQTMLDVFEIYGSDDAVFLTSFLPAGRGRKGHTGDTWIGRSHESDERGVVQHDAGWIEQECDRRGFDVRELQVDRRKQTWLLISKGEGATPSKTYLAELATGERDVDSLRRQLRRKLKRMFRRLGR